MAIKTPFDLHSNEYYKKSLFNIEEIDCQKEFWDIDETISELSYLTHDFFRYYGKFPSKVGKMIIEDLLDLKRIDKNNDFIVDNYAGSGTSLVEAKIAGIDSIGFDINPFAVLACRVKTYNYDISVLLSMWEKINATICKCDYHYKESIMKGLMPEVDETTIRRIDVETESLVQNEDFIRWFSVDVLRQLYIIKDTLLAFEYNKEREFFDLAFFAIIRRVSKAHDAEVRPHVNKKKRERDAIDAYVKKVNEMIETMNMWNHSVDNSIYSNSYLVSNTECKVISQIIKIEKESRKKQLGAVLSHPPYLNCFDYISVYKLKFMWADGFEEIFGQKPYSEIKASEIKSYPVNNDLAIERYFAHNYKAYQCVYDNLREGGYCCIVIGDCTVKGELFSVHKAFITMMQEIGFSLEKVAYRSTSYGMGRYAYSFRADYSENKESKQDAILFFKK